VPNHPDVDGDDVVPRTARGWSSRLRRPHGLVAQTRWLFCLAALLSLALALPAVLARATSATATLLLVAAGVLVLVWIFRYVSGSAPLVLDLTEAAAVTVLATNGANLAIVFGFVFPALWFRALFGSTTQVLLLCAYLSAGLLAVIMSGDAVVGPQIDSPAAMLPTITLMFLAAAVARYLARGLFAREEAQGRDAALVRLSNLLIGATDRTEILDVSRECAVALCAATDGLRLLAVEGTPQELRVVDSAGPLACVPATLPRAAVPVGSAPDGVHPVPDHRGLADLAGPRGAWVSLARTDQDDAWILLGAPRRVPTGAVAAVRTMTNLIALALRSSDAHQDLTTQARHDPLTGLANRSAFGGALEQALADPAGRVALLFLDLDDFKTVNDGMGHAAGDDLLRHVAARLRWAVRPDDLCARLGGDEFAVLLRDADDGAPAVAQRLVELIASPVSLKGRLAIVGASVGLAFAGRGTAPEELVQHADVAMYAAKAKGKNRVQAFDPSLLQDRDEAGVEADVAAATGAGELVVHYQPIVSVTDDRCVAVEALVRWQHPRRGLLAPAEFIGIAERTGAIGEIGAFVLRRACADAAAWTGRGDPLAVHVNVSAAQLTDPGFLDTVRDCLVEHAMAPETLVLEITEGMVLDSAPVRYALDRLAALGVSIAVDDFGTGYSALSIIRTLPLDIVKLDKSFLSNGPAHAADEAVVAAIVQMAGSLGLCVIAEGVERPDQQRFLRSVGVDAAQGHLHLRPTPADRFGLWLESRSAEALTPAATVTPIGRRIG
jgi:diguanylate cyclase (GGDEF)-like protein